MSTLAPTYSGARTGLLLVVMALAATLVLSGCPKPPAPPPPPPPTEPAPPAQPPAPTPETKETKPVSDKTILIIKTVKGDITVELYDKQTPITAGNFLLLAESGFYNDLTFHRVVPGFVIQGGDPSGDGSGGPGFTIPDETGKGPKLDRGILSMAKTAAPNSAGSQFFIVTGSASSVEHLNSSFSTFGKVLEGMDVVDKIAKGDKITTIEVKSTSPDAEEARQAAKEARINK